MSKSFSGQNLCFRSITANSTIVSKSAVLADTDDSCSSTELLPSSPPSEDSADNSSTDFLNSTDDLLPPAEDEGVDNADSLAHVAKYVTKLLDSALNRLTHTNRLVMI